MLLAALGLMHVPAAAAEENRIVLVIFSNARLLPANIEIERGLRETFANSANRHVEVRHRRRGASARGRLGPVRGT